MTLGDKIRWAVLFVQLAARPWQSTISYTLNPTTPKNVVVYGSYEPRALMPPILCLRVCSRCLGRQSQDPDSNSLCCSAASIQNRTSDLGWTVKTSNSLLWAARWWDSRLLAQPPNTNTSPPGPEQAVCQSLTQKNRKMTKDTHTQTVKQAAPIHYH